MATSVNQESQIIQKVIIELFFEPDLLKQLPGALVKFKTQFDFQKMIQLIFFEIIPKNCQFMIIFGCNLKSNNLIDYF